MSARYVGEEAIRGRVFVLMVTYVLRHARSGSLQSMDIVHGSNAFAPSCTVFN